MPRPKTGAIQIGLRLLPAEVLALDAWIGRRPKPLSRPEAIRSILDAVLALPAHLEMPHAALLAAIVAALAP